MADFRRALFNFLMFAFSATLRIDIGPARECITIHPSHSVPAYPMTCPDFMLMFCFRLDQLRVFQGANDEYALSKQDDLQIRLGINKSSGSKVIFFWGRLCIFD